MREWGKISEFRVIYNLKKSQIISPNNIKIPGIYKTTEKCRFSHSLLTILSENDPCNIYPTRRVGVETTGDGIWEL